jgi:membrane-associated protein
MELFEYLFNPKWIFLNFGNTALAIVLLIVFAETGIFIGFFLPGDSLLFTAGIFGDLLSKSFYEVPFFVIMLFVAFCAFLGNLTGYWFGNKSGKMLYKKKDSFLFKRRYLIMAKLFYTKYSGFALILSRFLPIFRTFSPIIAGIVKMNFRIFLLYNLIGAFLWTFSVMSAGYYLDKIFPNLKNHLEWIILGLVLFTTVPVVLKLVFSAKKKKRN